MLVMYAMKFMEIDHGYIMHPMHAYFINAAKLKSAGWSIFSTHVHACTRVILKCLNFIFYTLACLAEIARS